MSEGKKEELVAAAAVALAVEDSLRVAAWMPVVLANGEVWEGYVLEDGLFVKKFKVVGACQKDRLVLVGLDGRVVRGVLA